MAKKIHDELSALVENVWEEYLKWYNKNAAMSKIAYLGAQNLIVLLGFSTALIAALATSKNAVPHSDILLVVLPSVGALLGSLLTQFKVYDVWKIREDSKLAFELLINEINGKMCMATTPEEFYDLYIYLNDKINMIESEALRKYFSSSSASFVAQFKK